MLNNNQEVRLQTPGGLIRAYAGSSAGSLPLRGIKARPPTMSQKWVAVKSNA